MNFRRKEVNFWSGVFDLTGSALPLVFFRALFIGLFAALITAVDRNLIVPDIGVEVTPFEVAGVALSVLLGLRTNAGYERWWEARRLWGGIVNQSRNLAIAALSFGPDDPGWRDRIVRRAAAFCHASRLGLRGQRTPTELAAVLGPVEAARVLDAEHMPSAVARLIGESLREARELGLDGFALLRIDCERAALIDHVGACERILKTPLPLAYRIEIRRMVVVFLATLPFALVMRVGWLTPLFAFFVALPTLAIDKIGTELQYPFSTDSLNHLPLDEICATIQGNLLGLLEEDEATSPPLGDGQPSFGKTA